MVHLKKSFPRCRPSAGLFDGLKRFVLVLFLCLGGAGVLALFWFLSQLGPKAVDYENLVTSEIGRAHV